MVALGIFLFQLIAGPDDSSVTSILAGAWTSEIEMRTSTP